MVDPDGGVSGDLGPLDRRVGAYTARRLAEYGEHRVVGSGRRGALTLTFFARMMDLIKAGEPRGSATALVHPDTWEVPAVQLSHLAAERTLLLLAFDLESAMRPDVRPNVARLHSQLGLTCHPATARRWVQHYLGQPPSVERLLTVLALQSAGCYPPYPPSSAVRTPGSCRDVPLVTW